MPTPTPTSPVPLPRFHIRPQHGWINDPNGMTYAAGAWHVFYQHNPAGPVHADIHWGHASSPDLVTWTDHPIAFGPQPGGPDAFGCWSGAFAPGLGRPAVVYSGVAQSDGQSTVCLRWGSADLLTWSDPVVVGRTPHPEGVVIMRDPTPFTWAGRRWAIVGASVGAGEPAVLVFDAEDILDWRYAGRFADLTDPVLAGLPRAGIWECPQLVLIGDEAVLLVSRWLDGQLLEVLWVRGLIESASGAPRFRATGQAGVVDGGPSCYAPQVADGPGGPLLLGWVKPRPDQDGAVPVSGCLTLPRRLRLDADGLRSDVDPLVARALSSGATAQRVGSGRHTLPAYAACLLSGPARLTSEHASDAVLDLPEGTTVYVDADVAEAYPPSGPPITVRGLGGWRLELASGTAIVNRIDA
jgi:beta-fructofuranosidase